MADLRKSPPDAMRLRPSLKYLLKVCVIFLSLSSRKVVTVNISYFESLYFEDCDWSSGLTHHMRAGDEYSSQALCLALPFSFTVTNLWFEWNQKWIAHGSPKTHAYITRGLPETVVDLFSQLYRLLQNIRNLHLIFSTPITTRPLQYLMCCQRTL